MGACAQCSDKAFDGPCAQELFSGVSGTHSGSYLPETSRSPPSARGRTATANHHDASDSNDYIVDAFPPKRSRVLPATESGESTIKRTTLMHQKCTGRSESRITTRFRSSPSSGQCKAATARRFPLCLKHPAPVLSRSFPKLPADSRSLRDQCTSGAPQISSSVRRPGLVHSRFRCFPFVPSGALACHQRPVLDNASCSLPRRADSSA